MVMVGAVTALHHGCLLARYSCRFPVLCCLLFLFLFIAIYRSVFALCVYVLFLFVLCEFLAYMIRAFRKEDGAPLQGSWAQNSRYFRRCMYALVDLNCPVVMRRQAKLCIPHWHLSAQFSSAHSSIRNFLFFLCALQTFTAVYIRMRYSAWCRDDRLWHYFQGSADKLWWNGDAGLLFQLKYWSSDKNHATW